MIPSSTCHKEEWKGRCCCTCKFRLIDMSHPCTDGGKCTEHRGYICAVPEFVDVEGTQLVFSGWTEHGLCELHEFKEVK